MEPANNVKVKSIPAQQAVGGTLTIEVGRVVCMRSEVAKISDGLGCSKLFVEPPVAEARSGPCLMIDDILNVFKMTQEIYWRRVLSVNATEVIVAHSILQDLVD